MLNKGSRSRKRVRVHYWALAGKSAILGAIAGFFVCIFFTLFVILTTWIESPFIHLDELSLFARDMLMVAVVGGGLAAVTGCITGLAMSVIYAALARGGMTEKTGAIAGCLIGLALGCTFFLVTWALGPEGGCSELFCWLYVLLQYVGIPTLAWAWHGWQMARWLQKHSEPPAGEA